MENSKLLVEKNIKEVIKKLKDEIPEDKNVFNHLTREITDKYSTVEKLLENEKENNNSWEDKLNNNSSDLER